MWYEDSGSTYCLQIAHAPCWLHQIMYLMREERKVRCMTCLKQVSETRSQPSTPCRHHNSTTQSNQSNPAQLVTRCNST